MEHARLLVSGMSCGHCVSRVRKTLASLPGVTVTEVTIGEAKVQFDPERQSLTAVTGALDEAGYPARVE